MTQNVLKSAADLPLLNEANVLFRAKKYGEAAPLYRQLLGQERGDFLIWGYLGISLRYLGQYESAYACLMRADALSPQSSSIMMHTAICLQLLGRKTEAVQMFEAALRLSPHDFNIHAFYAYALREFDMNAQALPHYNEVLAQDPSHVETQWQRAQTLLAMGSYAQGWKEFEIRWALDATSPFHRQAELEKSYASQRWRGEDLHGKKILIYHEQGFGDTILASRYIPLVKARGAYVIFNCQPHLKRLLERIPGIDQLVEGEVLGGGMDYHAPLMSLPGIFNTGVNTVPPPVPLHVPAEMPPEAARLLALAKNRFKVGIVWSGNPYFTANARRAVPLSRFLPLAAIPGVQLFSLQKGLNEQDIAAACAQPLIPALAPHLNDFADTAAVLKQLDLVIMTDSAVAHLAGALDVPVWNLISTGAYWLYLTGRDDSPWYPSMRLFRQQEPGDWEGVFERVQAELKKIISLRKP